MDKRINGKNKSRSGKLNRFYRGGTFSVLIEMDDLDPAINDDEATLESTDGTYKKTLKVAEEGVKVDDKFLRLTFTGVIPGKEYTMIYDLKKDSEGNELGTITMFYELLIEQADMDKLDPVEYHTETEEEDDIPYWEPVEYDEEAVALYQEPDIDADEEAILISEEVEDVESEEQNESEEDFEEEI